MDEAHNVKNIGAKTSKAIRTIKSDHRLLLTGTPVLNNLADFYGLMDAMSEGAILANITLSTFKRQYLIPIEAGRKNCANSFEVGRANRLSKMLRDKSNFWILRRTKKDLSAQAADIGSNLDVRESKEFQPLPPKHDYVLWCKMTDIQLKIYKSKLIKKIICVYKVYYRFLVFA